MSSALDGDTPVETADRSGAFPRLDDGQLAALEAIGERRRVQRGGVLFREGDAHYDFFVILSGKVAIVEGYDSGCERTIGVHGERRFPSTRASCGLPAMVRWALNRRSACQISTSDATASPPVARYQRRRRLHSRNSRRFCRRREWIGTRCWERRCRSVRTA